MLGFGGNDRDAVVGMLADVAGGSNAADAVAQDDNVLHSVDSTFLVLCLMT